MALSIGVTTVGHTVTAIANASHVGVQQETIFIPNFSYGLTPTGMQGWDPNTLYPGGTLRQIVVWANMITDVSLIFLPAGAYPVTYYYGQSIYYPNHNTHALNLYRAHSGDPADVLNTLLVENIVTMPDQQESLSRAQTVVIAKTLNPRYLTTLTDPADLATFSHTGSVPLYYNRIFLNTTITEGGSGTGPNTLDYGVCAFTFSYVFTY